MWKKILANTKLKPECSYTQKPFHPHFIFTKYGKKPVERLANFFIANLELTTLSEILTLKNVAVSPKRVFL